MRIGNRLKSYGVNVVTESGPSTCPSCNRSAGVFRRVASKLLIDTMVCLECAQRIETGGTQPAATQAR